MGRRLTILLGDHDPDRRRLLFSALAGVRGGASVVTASTSEELAGAARRHRCHGVVVSAAMACAAPEVLGRFVGPRRGAACIVIAPADAARPLATRRLGADAIVSEHEAIVDGLLCARLGACIAVRRARRGTGRRRGPGPGPDIDPVTGLPGPRFVARAMLGAAHRSPPGALTAAAVVGLDAPPSGTDGPDWGRASLGRVGRALRDAAADAEVVGRLAGDRFVALRRASSITEAWVWADGLRRAVRAGAGPAHASASVGVDLIATSGLRPSGLAGAHGALRWARSTGGDRACTTMMAEAAVIAEALRDVGALTLRERLLVLIDRLRVDLGPTQRDHLTARCMDVRARAVRAGRVLIDDPEELRDLKLAAEFHDIGKLAVPEELLALPRRLSRGERRFVDEHARFGGGLLRAAGAGERAAAAVEHHHTRFDARGSSAVQHPDGRPTLASILSACDALAGMCSERGYAPRLSESEAIAELRAQRGARYHPIVVDSIAPAGRAVAAAA